MGERKREKEDVIRKKRKVEPVMELQRREEKAKVREKGRDIYGGVK